MYCTVQHFALGETTFFLTSEALLWGERNSVGRDSLQRRTLLTLFLWDHERSTSFKILICAYVKDDGS